MTLHASYDGSFVGILVLEDDGETEKGPFFWISGNILYR